MMNKIKYNSDPTSENEPENSLVEGSGGETSKFEISCSENGGCFLCSREDQEVFLAREGTSGRLTALCGSCLIHHLDDYLIDNTCPWPFWDENKP